MWWPAKPAAHQKNPNQATTLGDALQVSQKTEAGREVEGESRQGVENDSVKSDQDITTDSSCQVDLSLQVQLDPHHERGGLELARVIDGALEEVSHAAVGIAGKIGHRKALRGPGWSELVAGHSNLGDGSLGRCRSRHIDFGGVMWRLGSR